MYAPDIIKVLACVQILVCVHMQCIYTYVHVCLHICVLMCSLLGSKWDAYIGVLSMHMAVHV